MRLFQSFSFGTTTLDLIEKRALDRFFGSLFQNSLVFWNKLDINKSRIKMAYREKLFAILADLYGSFLARPCI
jgi:hypothetical protein